MSLRRRPLPEPTRSEYPSGLRVLSEEMPGTRSVALAVWVDVGSRDERPEIAGASHFLEHLLFKGTRSRTGREISEAFDAIGGDLNAFSAKEYTCYYCRVLDRDLPTAVELMSDMLQHSTFGAFDFEAERQVILEEIQMHEDDPDELVHDLFAETLWRDHPLGRPILGTRETIRGMGRDQVKRFYRRLYRPPHFVVAAAGNLRHDDLCRLFERHMTAADEGAPAPQRRSRARKRPPVPSGARRVLRRDTEQAHLCVGTSAYSRRDRERFAFGVVNSALGGGMSSRLFEEVREKRGLAYAVYSYHAMYTETGSFGVYAGTTPSKAREVLSIVRGVIEALAGGDLSEAELERAKGHMKGSFVLSLEDTSGRMSRIGKSEVSHGEILSVDEVLARIEAVTLEEAHAVARDVFARPQSLAVIGPFDEDAFDDAESTTSALRGEPATDDVLVAAHSLPGPAEGAGR